MEGKVSAIIDRLNEYGRQYKFGFILGKDQVSYYFDKYSLSYAYRNMNLYYEGCLVEFDPIIQTEQRNDKAINIRILTQTVTNEEADKKLVAESDVRFYKPGIVGHIKDNKVRIYKQMLKANTGEDTIIEGLSLSLYVTKIGSHTMDGNVYYPFCLVGVTDLLKRFVRGQREFLLVFSHFDARDWQDKTLRVENEIRKRKDITDRNPLPNFYVLISNATNLKEEIDRIKGEPRAAIIPFTYSELLACKGNKSDLESLLLERFHEYHFENNLLGENKAIEDDNLLFGDRGKIADAIVERCRQRNHSGIFGLRRSGKTSVLNATLRRLDREGLRYIKIESRSDFEFTSKWQIALYDITQKIKQILGAGAPIGESKDSYLENGPRCFVNDFKHLWTNDNPFVIAIDEIELITYNTASAATWQSLEAYSGFWSALRDSGCIMIVCGVNSSINEKSIIEYDAQSKDNPMYGRIINCSEAHKTYLPAFTDEQTRLMINTLGGYSGIVFSQVYSDINRAFGGQPYSIRQFCAYVFDNVKGFRKPDEDYDVPLPTIRNLLEQFNNSNAGFSLCETMLQHIHYYKDEFNTLARFAHSPHEYNRIESSEAQSIDHLVKYGLLDYDFESGYTSFKVDSIKDYICKNLQKDPLSMNDEERRRFVQDFVAEFEKKLKSHILTYYRAIGKENSFPSALRQYFTLNPTQRQKLDVNSSSLKDLLDHKKFILHFSTLKRIYVDNWTTLGQIFNAQGINQQNFKNHMQDLNAGRTDADHYSPSELTIPNGGWNIDDVTIRRFCFARDILKDIL